MATTSIDELLEVIKGMTVLELSVLHKAFEEEFGVTAAAPVGRCGRRRSRRRRRRGGASRRRTSSTSCCPPPATRRSR